MYYWSRIKQKATIHQSFFRNSISFHPPSAVTLSTLDHRPFHEKSEAMTTSCIELLWSHPKAPRWPMDGSFPRFCCMWNDGFLNGKEKSWMKGACLKMKTISLLMGLSKNISWRFLLERLPPTCHGEERSGLVAPPFWMLSKEKKRMRHKTPILKLVVEFLKRINSSIMVNNVILNIRYFKIIQHGVSRWYPKSLNKLAELPSENPATAGLPDRSASVVTLWSWRVDVR